MVFAKLKPNPMLERGQRNAKLLCLAVSKVIFLLGETGPEIRCETRLACVDE